MSEDFVENVTKWLVSRQTIMLREEDELPMAAEELPHATPPEFFPPPVHVHGAFPVSVADAMVPHASIEMPSHDLQWAGFNGRCNKVADTCYAFWVGGTLGVSFFCCSILQASANQRPVQDAEKRTFARLQRRSPLFAREDATYDWRFW